MRVDLPAPLGPSRPMALPVPDVPRRQVIPCRISRRPSLTFRFSSSMTGAVLTVSLSCQVGRRLVRAEGADRHQVQNHP